MTRQLEAAVCGGEDWEEDAEQEDYSQTDQILPIPQESYEETLGKEGWTGLDDYHEEDERATVEERIQMFDDLQNRHRAQTEGTQHTREPLEKHSNNDKIRTSLPGRKKTF